MIKEGPGQQEAKDLASEGMVKKVVFPRVGFLGNPSDGFFGKTIGFPIKNFQSEIIIWPSEVLKFIPNADDQDEFSSVEELFATTQSKGYYGGIRLLKAAISVFFRYCKSEKIKIPKQNFTLSYRSNIPQQRGLAGSSAIITGTLLALIDFYGVDKKYFLPPILARITLEAETEELNIAAGLQDRVVQAYNAPVYMDFSKEAFSKNDNLFGEYKTFDQKLLPAMGLCWSDEMSESGKVHSNVRSRFEAGDKETIESMSKFASLAETGMEALKKGDLQKIFRLVDANFNLRRKLYGDKVIGSINIKMIEAARKLGAAAKFPGSGGAILVVSSPSKIDKIIAGLNRLGYNSSRIIL